MKKGVQILNGIVVLMIFVNCSYAQVTTIGFGEMASLQNDMGGPSVKQSTLRYANIKGSPYNDSEFVKSDIHFKNGNVFKGVWVRLNLYEKNLEFEKGKEYFILESLAHISKITFSNQEIVFIEGGEDSDLDGFYKINTSGENKFLSSLRVVFKDATSPSNSYSEPTEAEFKREKELYYLQLEDGKLLGVKNKKQFYSYFSSNNESLVKYVKSNKLNPTKFDDLIEITVYMNSEAQL